MVIKLDLSIWNTYSGSALIREEDFDSKQVWLKKKKTETLIEQKDSDEKENFVVKKQPWLKDI